MLDVQDTIIIDIKGDKVEIAYTASPRGVLLDCLAYVHPAKKGGRGRQEELEDLLPDWNARADIRDLIHRRLYESR